MVDQAKAHARPKMNAQMPSAKHRITIVCLKPLYLLTLRGKFMAMFPGSEAENLATNAFLFEEFLVRRPDAETMIIADGTSGRHQIKDGTQRKATHVAIVLADALAWSELSKRLKYCDARAFFSSTCSPISRPNIIRFWRHQSRHRWEKRMCCSANRAYSQRCKLGP